MTPGLIFELCLRWTPLAPQIFIHDHWFGLKYLESGANFLEAHTNNNDQHAFLCATKKEVSYSTYCSVVKQQKQHDIIDTQQHTSEDEARGRQQQ